MKITPLILKFAADNLSGKVHRELEDRFTLSELPPETKGVKPDVIRQGILKEVKDGDEVVAYARIRSYQEPGKEPKYSLGVKHFPKNQESETEVSKEIFDAFYPDNLDKPQEKNRYKLAAGWVVDLKKDGEIVAEKEKVRDTETKVPEHWIQKTAVDLAGLRLAYQPLKGKVIRAGVKGTHYVKHGFGLNASNPEIFKNKRAISHFLGANAYLAPKVKQSMMSSGLTSPKIMMGQRGAAGFLSSGHGNEGIRGAKELIGKLNPQNREALNRVAVLHEGFESNIKTKNMVPMNSHISPEVMLREHNLVSTLPKELEPTRSFYKDLRRYVGDTGKLSTYTNKQFQYGESPRLSRHAIKRLSSSISRKIESQNPINENHFKAPKMSILQRLVRKIRGIKD